MRWRFPDPADAAEEAERRKVLSRIDNWWKEFRLQAGDLDAHFNHGKEFDIPEWMARTLQGVDDRLCWEFGPALKEGHRLVITPESDHALRPMVEVILERAPRLKGWEFYGHRLPESLAEVEVSVSARTGGSLTDVVVEVKPGKHHLIDLVFFSPACRPGDDRQASNDAFVAVECLLGEEILDSWIGIIEAKPLQEVAGRKTVSPNRLKEAVDLLIQEVKDRLPEDPWFVLTASDAVPLRQGTIYRLKPEEAPEYPLRKDLLIARTVYPEMWEAAHQSGLFDSGRFSKCGETFCYLTLDGSKGIEQEKFPDRASIEDALDAALKPAEVGGVLGGGTGLKYSYIDLALTGVDSAIPILRKVLQGGSVPRRSWLLFFDSDFQDEWAGAWSDSPPPPMDPDPA